MYFGDPISKEGGGRIWSDKTDPQHQGWPLNSRSLRVKEGGQDRRSEAVCCHIKSCSEYGLLESLTWM